MPAPDPDPVAVELMGHFACAWENAERPDAADYLACAAEHGDACRDQLADLITTYLTWAPTPPYSPEQVRALVDEARRIMRGGHG